VRHLAHRDLPGSQGHRDHLDRLVGMGSQGRQDPRDRPETLERRVPMDYRVRTAHLDREGHLDSLDRAITARHRGLARDTAVVNSGVWRSEWE